MKENKDIVSRKRFLQICGSFIAGGSILGVSGILLKRMYTAPKETCKKQGVDPSVGSQCSNCKKDCPLKI